MSFAVTGRRGRLLCSVALLAALTCSDAGHHFNAQVRGQATVQAFSAPENLTLRDLNNIDLIAHPQLSSQGVLRSHLNSVRLFDMTLRVAEPSSRQDLQFLNSIDVFAGDASGPLVAHGDSFTAGLTVAGLDVGDVELKTYFAANPQSTLSLVVRATYNANAPVPQNTVLELSPTFQVRVAATQSICNN